MIGNRVSEAVDRNLDGIIVRGQGFIYLYRRLAYILAKRSTWYQELIPCSIVEWSSEFGFLHWTQLWSCFSSPKW
jgi:hypothetical protein